MEMKGKVVLITGAIAALGADCRAGVRVGWCLHDLNRWNPVQLRGVAWLKVDFTDQT